MEHEGLSNFLVVKTCETFSTDKSLARFCYRFPPFHVLIDSVVLFHHPHFLDYFCFISAISCGSPPSLENGRVNVESTTFNSVASYACRFGYILRGSSVRVCRDDGTWSRTSMRCERKRNSGWECCIESQCALKLAARRLIICLHFTENASNRISWTWQQKFEKACPLLSW